MALGTMNNVPNAAYDSLIINISINISNNFFKFEADGIKEA